MNAPKILQRRSAVTTDERAEVVAGLLSTQATLSPKYFYDPQGCAIYSAICQLAEYYPTRTEQGIFQAHRQAIAEVIGRGGQLVDLGAGDCAKARGWMTHLAPSHYVAVDIAGPEIERALKDLAQEFPQTRMTGLVTDFSIELDLTDALLDGPVTFFYPGSSIGNFSQEEAERFLSGLARHCAGRPGSGLLIGVDAKKSRPLLEAAYDDALGVTAAFNVNALRHLNGRFDFDFNIERFRHRALYNEAVGRIEMHLESRCEQKVTLGDVVRHFATGETIHTENSYKYSPDEFIRLLARAGFAHAQCWSDDKGWFNVFHARLA
jgi:dimethylhistidine N-methyltransferase